MGWLWVGCVVVTQTDEPSMSMSTQLYDIIVNPGAESPGTTTPRDSGTLRTLEHSQV